MKRQLYRPCPLIASTLLAESRTRHRLTLPSALQTGHMLIILVLLLSGSISYPGFPLTQVPDEYRALIWQVCGFTLAARLCFCDRIGPPPSQGLGITFFINAVAAVYSIGLAQRKEQPVVFWAIKVLVFGGLALGELKQAVPDPATLRKAEWRASQKNQPRI